MEALLGFPEINTQNRENWSLMIVVSLVFHGLVFSSIWLIPESIPTGKIDRVIYEVDLVDTPSKVLKSAKTRTHGGKPVATQIPSKSVPTKRIRNSSLKGKPVVIAKKTVNVKADRIQSTEGATAKLLDQAMEKMAPPVTTGNDLNPNQSVSRIDTQPVNRNNTGSTGVRSTGVRSTDGIIMEIYKSEIKNLIYSNWTYVSFRESSRIPDLTSVVVLEVDKNGNILKTTMAKSSGDSKFDASVLKAIKKTGTLLPFPEGYRKTHEEIEVNFNTSDLKNQ